VKKYWENRGILRKVLTTLRGQNRLETEGRDGGGVLLRRGEGGSPERNKRQRARLLKSNQKSRYSQDKHGRAS